MGITTEGETMMSQTLTLEVADTVYEILQEAAQREGKRPEQVAQEWVVQQAQSSRRGGVETLQPFFGSWQMTFEERVRIEQEIYDLRHLEEEK